MLKSAKDYYLILYKVFIFSTLIILKLVKTLPLLIIINDITIVLNIKINNEIDFEGAKAALYTKDGKPRAKKQIEVLELLEAAGCEMSIEDITGFISSPLSRSSRVFALIS